jgi:hypothetical protein
MIKNEEIEKLKRDLIFQPLNSMQELQDWMYLYFDIYFPSGVVYPTSTHGPADAMWRIYELMKTGQSAEVPEVVMKASRDSGKTLAAAALEVLCMIHFRISLCHMAAISSQSLKAVQYVELFFRKIEDYLLSHNWSKNSSNKRMIEWIDDTGQNLYLKIVIATIAGANSEHVPMLFCVDGKTEILVKNIVKKTKHNHKSVTASAVYRRISKGKPVEVVSFNHKSSILEYKSVEKACVSIKDIYRLKLENLHYIDLSLDHPVFVKNKGYIPVKDIEVDVDEVLFVHKTRVGGTLRVNFNKKEITENSLPEPSLEELVLGSLLGDAGCYKKKSNNAYVREAHCVEQEEYLKWKQYIYIKNKVKCSVRYTAISGYTKKTQPVLVTGNNEYFNKFSDFKKNFHKNGMLENITPWILAIWYQDDGCKNNYFKIATHNFEPEQVHYLSELINKKFGFSTNLYWERHKDGRSYPVILGGVLDLIILKKICKDMFHHSMRYKLLEDSFEKTKTSCFFKVRSIDYIKTDFVYDFTVKDNHNFIANKILIRNCDEIDVIQDSRALSEAKLIPSNYKHFQPLMVYLSTLKFSGGLMQQTLDSVKKNGGEVLSWNVIDITERITPEVARVNEPKVTRYISTTLPMVNLSKDQWKDLKEEDKNKYEKIEAYAGIAEHPMLPVMKNYLVERPEKDKGGLFKKLFATHNMFKKVSPEMAEAQLLCHKPESTNLVYPRFDTNFNTLTVAQAWEKITGNVNPHATFQQLRDFLIAMGCPFIGGGDFGFSDYNSFVVVAMLPGGHTLQVDHFLGNNMEPDDTVAKMVEIQKHWNIEKWFVDQNRPDIVKTLRKRGLKVPDFTKDVAEGIGAFQSRIVDSSGVRKFFILNTPENNFAIEAFGFYRWALDGKGEIIEGKPHHDRDGYSDYFDSIRYIYQNLFAKNNKVIFSTAHSDKEVQKPKIQNQSLEQMAEETNKALVQNKMQELIPEGTDTAKKARTTKKILWM